MKVYKEVINVGSVNSRRKVVLLVSYPIGCRIDFVFLGHWQLSQQSSPKVSHSVTVSRRRLIFSIHNARHTCSTLGREKQGFLVLAFADPLSRKDR